jgi:hypothetical protein
VGGIILSLVLSSCDFVSSLVRHDKVVAEVMGKRLTETELYRNLDLTGLSSSDSADAIDVYVRDWASSTLMYELARDEFSGSKELDSLVESYRQSLYVYEYELRLIKEHLSTQITDDQVFTYYKENSSLFYLQEPLVQGVLMTLLNKSPDYEVIKLLMESPRDTNMDMIESYSVKNAAKFDYFNNTWTLFSEIQKKCPLPIHEVDFKEKTLYTETDSVRTVFLYVTKCVSAGDMQPFEFAKSRIRSILTEQRKTGYLRSYRNELYERGLSNGSVKRY